MMSEPHVQEFPAMQLAATTSPSAAAPKAPAVPAITGGIDFTGTGRFTKFSAKATDVAYGAEGGYATLQEAMDEVTFETVGARKAAAGIFELDGRFHARLLDNSVTFSSGKTWKGYWKLEQFPADLELLNGTASGTTTRSSNLVAVVDGAQRIDVTKLPTA
jgi:hypothetical protein